MADACKSARFLHEPCAQRFVISVSPAEGLDRHLPSQPLVKPEKNSSHAPGADLAQDVMSGEPFRQFFSCSRPREGPNRGGSVVHHVQRVQQRAKLTLQLHVCFAEGVDVYGFFAG
jgi:hypothetical protein